MDARKLFTLFLLIFTSCFANACKINEYSSHKLYAGAAAGYDSYKLSLRTENIADTVQSIRQKERLNAPGLLGNVSLGYGGSFWYRSSYLGGEIFGNYSSANAHTKTVVSDLLAYKTRITIGPSFGVSLLPGISTCGKSLLYVRLGFIGTRLEIHQSASMIQIPYSQLTEEKWIYGASFGLGMEGKAGNRFRIGSEYNYILYRSFESNHSVDHPSLISSVTNTKVSPANSQFLFRLIYDLPI